MKNIKKVMEIFSYGVCILTTSLIKSIALHEISFFVNQLLEKSQ